MSNKITNTGILNKSYNGRGIVVHRSVSQPLVRSSEGVLWAAVRTGVASKNVTIYKSEDDGFSWRSMYTGTFSSVNNTFARQTGLNHNGSHLFLHLFEAQGKLVLLHTTGDINGTEFKVERWVWNISDMALQQSTPLPIALDQDYEAISATNNDKNVFIVSTNFSDLYVDVFQPSDITIAETPTKLTGDFFNVFDSKATDDGFVEIAVVSEASTYYSIQFVRFNSGAKTYSSPIVVNNTPNKLTISDVNIARNGWGHILVGWTQETGITPALESKYSISTDNGATWSVAQSIPYVTGSGAFTDAPTGQLSARLAVLGGTVGWVLSYTRTNAQGVGRTFVRLLTSNDGTAYTLGDEKELATQTTLASETVAGARFFQPSGTKLMDLSDPSHIRVAYQVGQGNSTIQADSRPIRIGQELLGESAFPAVVSNTSLSVDTPGEDQLVATVQVMAGPSATTDYYALGVVGPVTDRYMSAFERVGTEMRILRYDPIPGSEMDDRSAYSAPVADVVKVVLTPQSYDAPTLAGGTDTFKTYIERDVRQLHLPPDFWLGREFLVNRGGHLKRTVWTVLYDGNEYELSQVVPYFLDNKICYYSANAYVVGPSNNPFSKTILPSET